MKPRPHLSGGATAPLRLGDVGSEAPGPLEWDHNRQQELRVGVGCGRGEVVGTVTEV